MGLYGTPPEHPICRGLDLVRPGRPESNDDHPSRKHLSCWTLPPATNSRPSPPTASRAPAGPDAPLTGPPTNGAKYCKKKAPWSLQDSVVNVRLKTGLAKKSGQDRMGPTAKGRILTVYLCETHRRSRQPGGPAPTGSPPASSISATNTQNTTLSIANTALITGHATSASSTRRRSLKPWHNAVGFFAYRGSPVLRNTEGVPVDPLAYETRRQPHRECTESGYVTRTNRSTYSHKRANHSPSVPPRLLSTYRTRRGCATPCSPRTSPFPLMRQSGSSRPPR